MRIAEQHYAFFAYSDELVSKCDYLKAEYGNNYLGE